MDEVLSEINFDEGIAMPVANDENKKIEFQVSDKFPCMNSSMIIIEQIFSKLYSPYCCGGEQIYMVKAFYRWKYRKNSIYE